MTDPSQTPSALGDEPALGVAHRFTDAEISAVYKAIALRRDIRHFRAGQVPEEQRRQPLGDLVADNIWPE
ncbi:MAG: hypothetical protein WAV07_10995 [Candidatus Contendobacter sp.]